MNVDVAIFGQEAVGGLEHGADDAEGFEQVVDERFDFRQSAGVASLRRERQLLDVVFPLELGEVFHFNEHGLQRRDVVVVRDEHVFVVQVADDIERLFPPQERGVVFEVVLETREHQFHNGQQVEFKAAEFAEREYRQFAYLRVDILREFCDFVEQFLDSRAVDGRRENAVARRVRLNDTATPVQHGARYDSDFPRDVRNAAQTVSD